MKVTIISFILILALCESIKSFNKPFRFSKSVPIIQPEALDKEYSIFSLSTSNLESGDGGENGHPSGVLKEREQLYEAYNLLHTLAQDFKKPFDSPAVIVVGHQTSGKSALIEALMGFQFNQVGGGTKTRRPIALRMQYNPSCTTPTCFLTLDNGKEEQKSLQDIQDYIEAENKRLEKDSTRSYDPREINIRMEYKYCPNMILIDTPGMLHPPKGRHLTPQQRALAQASREAENLILNKIKCQDYIILCVEDTTDWKHATTRNIVMQADPNLARTVLVTTKLDTKLPQFSEASDLKEFLAAPIMGQMFQQMMGGPFFTSVPAGRVGTSKDFDSNDEFVRSLKGAEQEDRGEVISSLGAAQAGALLPRVGVSRLRTFLEARVEDCYRRNVKKIVPLLQKELQMAEQRLAATDEELNSLSLEKLKQTANAYRERFSKELQSAVQGSIKVSPEEWGETLETEQTRGGTYLGRDQMDSPPWQRTLELEVGNSRAKLYGGAQYHRALREFTVAVRHMKSPRVTEDEIHNAAGMGDTHNGVNFMRAACIIAMEKAQDSFDPVLESLRQRTVHVMKRLYPIVETMMRKNNGNDRLDMYNKPFQDVIHNIYDKFIEIKVDECLRKCRDDLSGMTRFVTWDVDDKGDTSTLYRLLPTPKKMVEIYHLAVEKKKKLGAPNTDGASSSPRKFTSRQLQHQQRDEEDRFNSLMVEESMHPARDAEDDEEEVAPLLPEERKILQDWKQANSNAGSSGRQSGIGAIYDRMVGQFGGGSTATAAQSHDQQLRSESQQQKLRRQQQRRIDSASSAFPPSSSRALTPYPPPGRSRTVDDAEMNDYYKVMQLTEEMMLGGGGATRTSALVTSLVQFIISSWRNHFARATAMKFNCFFLMPFMDEFPSFLRSELDAMYEGGVGDLFDIAETRRTLIDKRAELIAECQANSKLQRRFDHINAQLQGGSSSSNSIGTNSFSNAGDGGGGSASGSASGIDLSAEKLSQSLPHHYRQDQTDQ